jgi:outer membrane usher protein
MLVWTVAAHAEDKQAILKLYVNEVAKADVFVALQGDDALVARADLEAAGVHGFTGSDFEVTRHKLLSLMSMRPRVKFVVDLDLVALRITVPTVLLGNQHFDLGGAPPDLSYVHRPSVFLNYAPTVDVVSSGPVTGTAFFESGVSEKNRLWYSGLYASTTSAPARGLSNLTFDDRPKMIRLTFGDMNVSAGAIGGAAIIGGVTLARDFSMNPYFIRFPSMKFTSSTDVPATVDLYENGVRVKSVAIDTGTFTLDDIRLIAGAGTVTYVVRNALGLQQSFSTPYYVAPTVLKEGLTDFAVSLGFPRDNLGIDSFDYEGPALISYYQLGISNTLTLGARAEGRYNRGSFGPYLATTTPVGVFSLEGGASLATGPEAGVAGIFSYQYLSRWFNVLTTVRALSDYYATATLTPQMDRSLFQASNSISVPIGKRASFAGDFSVDIHRDVPALARVGAFSQLKVSRALTVLAEIALVTEAAPKSSLDGFLELIWTPDGNMNGSIGVTKTGPQTAGNVQFSKTATVGEDWSLTAAADLSDNPEGSISHRLQTSVNTITSYFDWQPGSASFSVQPAGSVAWVQGEGFFLSRPIFDAFALVRVPDLKDVRISLYSQEVGRTNAQGNLLVPSLVSYYGSQLKVVSEDVPLAYTLDIDTILAAPPRRGAAYVEFAAVRVHYYRGRLRVVKKGVVVVPTFGDFAVTNRGKEMLSPIGDDGTFELEGLSSGTHQAEVRHTSGVCRFTFEAKEADLPLIDLGMLVCESN